MPTFNWKLLVLSGLVAAPLHAAVVVADFNDLNTGNLQPQGGGTGLNGTWGDTGTINVVAGNLVAPASTNYAITQTGTAQSIVGGHTEYRQAGRALTTTLTGTVWFSFLASNVGATSNAGITFNVPSYTAGLPRIGITGNSFYAGLTSYADTGSTVTFGQAALILGRIVINAAGDETLDVWLNPDVSGGIAGLGAATASETANVATLDAGISRLGVATFRNATGTGGTLDAVRLSDNIDANQAFADVTGILIPEPSALLLSLAGLGIFLRRSR